ISCVFFFQAEDGIRDFHVTGVQTCALPILPEEDFNSYATHRGDHLTAQRATFASPKLFNEMVLNEDGSVRQGSLARVEPDGKVRSEERRVGKEGRSRWSQCDHRNEELNSRH